MPGFWLRSHCLTRKRHGQHWPGWFAKELLMEIKTGDPLEFIFGVCVKHLPTVDNAAIDFV
jgi:hypothetical protein